MKLNQVIAIEKNKRTEAQRKLTDAYQMAKKQQPFLGQTRTYQPLDDEGETLPQETALPALTVDQLLTSLRHELADALNVVATKEIGNRFAVADVIVEGKIVMEEVPVTYLLYLEKFLVDMRTFIGNLPTLDPSERWAYDEASGHYVSAPVTTNRTKKMPRTLIKYEATDKHPAQTEVYFEDVTIGHWLTTKFSGALPAPDAAALLAKIALLQDAVKIAREAANNIEVELSAKGTSLLNWLLG